MPHSMGGTPVQTTITPRVIPRNGAREGYGQIQNQDLQETPSTELGAGPLFGNPPATSLLSHQPVIQAKLEVGSPDDPLEQEADQMADQVIQRMAFDTPPPLPPSTESKPSIQRKCADCEQDEVVQAKFESPPSMIRTKGMAGISTASPQVSSQIHASKGGGNALPPALLTNMQAGFGQDLSQVRLHTDGQAATLSRELNARAFTVGSDIYFGAGQYQPESKAGQHLLAHELTHTLQQKGKSNGMVQRHICTLPSTTGTLPSTRLSAADLATRISNVRTTITAMRTAYPLASANLEHWLGSTATDRIVRLSEYDFSNGDTGIPAWLDNTHRSRIEGGVRARMNPAHAESLLPVGTTRTISWMDSMRAQVFTRSGTSINPTGPMQRDLAVALGGFTVKSIVTVRARDARTVEVLSWRVQVCDRYDWIIGAQAMIFVPAGIAVPPIPPGAATVHTFFGHTVIRFNDTWMAEIESSGGARSYNIFSEEFNSPSHISRDFTI